MKLFDVLKENALRAFASNRNINVYIGPDTTDKDLIKEVQKALSKHSLAIGKRPQGKYWDNSKKAWTGGTTGIYDNNLKMSVAEWQKSVNNQIKDMAPEDRIRLLTINGVINREDAKILTAPLDRRGFLINTKLANAVKNYEAVRRAFTDRRISIKDVDKIDSFQEFIAGIGREGWWAILHPIVREKWKDKFFKPGNTTSKEIINFLEDGTAKILMARNKDILFNTLRELIRPLSPMLKAKTMSGKQITLIPDTTRLIELTTAYNTPNPNKITDLNTPKSLFIHFAGIAMHEFDLGVKSAEKAKQDKEKEEQKSLQNDTANIDQLTARDLAKKLVVAFENDYWAIFTSKRVSVDDDSVEDVLQKLANAKDYDEVAKQYLNLTDNHLSIDMVKELSKDDLYNRLFISHMKRIRRINPNLLHKSIQFDQNNTPIAVTDKNGAQYEVTNEMVDGRPVINPEVKDVILEDYLLREAITASGGTVPDLFIQPTEEQRIDAVNTFVEVMERTYPEMARFYGHLPPFDEYSPIGPLRLKGIINEAVVYISAGADPVSFIEQSIKEDRIWLVGDGSDNDGDGEPDGGNANIYFDPRYAEEGASADPERFNPVGEEEIELSKDDLEIIQKLASGKDDLIESGIEELFQMSNARKHYIDVIYPGYKKQQQSYIEETLGIDGKNNWVEAYFSDGDTPNMPMFSLLLRRFAGTGGDPNDVIAFVAPAGVAKVFDKVLNDNFNLNEDKLLLLVKSIQGPDDFAEVDKYYEGNLREHIRDKNWTLFGDPIFDELIKKIGIDREKQEAVENFEEVQDRVQKKLGLIKKYAIGIEQGMEGIEDQLEETKEAIGDLEEFMDEFIEFTKDYVKTKDNNKDYKLDAIETLIYSMSVFFDEKRDYLMALEGYEKASDKYQKLKDIRLG